MTPGATLRNKLLQALPPDELRSLRERLELVPLKHRRVLHHAKLPIEHVYFVETGIVSVVANTDDDNLSVEAWLIGCDGIVGVPVVLGMETLPHRRMVQVEGVALRISTPDLLQALDDLPSFRPILLRYVGSILVQAGQGAACNARHTLPQRLARWLLMIQDRIGGDDLPLTHDIMSKMLGVRRASVTQTLHVLADSGAVAPERRCVRVLDRERLESLTCGCYCTMRAEFDRIASSVDSAFP